MERWNVTATNALVQALVWTTLLAAALIAWLYHREATSGVPFGLIYQLQQVLTPLQAIWIGMALALFLTTFFLFYPRPPASQASADCVFNSANVTSANALMLCGALEPARPAQANEWNIAGIDFNVTANTQVDAAATLSEGAPLRVYVTRSSDGTWVATGVQNLPP